MKSVNAQYFEGILQLRNPNKEVKEYVISQIEQNDNVFVSKIVKVRGGYDYYLSSNRFLKTLGYKLRKAFGGELKLSSKLFSRDRQTSKEIHRVNVLYRCWDIRRGSIVEYRGDKVEIMAIGNKIQGRRIEDGKRVYINFKEL